MRTFLVGICYSVVIILAILFLAAVQLRSGAGAKYDTWRLTDKASLKTLEDLRDSNRAERKTLREQDDNIAFYDECLKLYGDNHLINSDAENRITALKQARGEEFKDDNRYDEQNCKIRGYLNIVLSKNQSNEIKMAAQNQIIENDRQINVIQQQNEVLLQSNVPEVTAFREMENIWYLEPFVVIPYDVLVQLLVVLTGLAGGMVRVLREYGDPARKDPEWRDYFILPLIGAVVAFGGYILAKTGLLLLSSANGEASLSPYMVGFVGIVSGLLAREVIDRFAQVGREWLNGGQNAVARAVSEAEAQVAIKKDELDKATAAAAEAVRDRDDAISNAKTATNSAEQARLASEAQAAAASTSNDAAAAAAAEKAKADAEQLARAEKTAQQEARAKTQVAEGATAEFKRATEAHLVAVAHLDAARQAAAAAHDAAKAQATAAAKRTAATQAGAEANATAVTQSPPR